MTSSDALKIAVFCVGFELDYEKRKESVEVLRGGGGA